MVNSKSQIVDWEAVLTGIFRGLGFIDYDDDGLTVHSGLLSVVLHD